MHYTSNINLAKNQRVYIDVGSLGDYLHILVEGDVETASSESVELYSASDKTDETILFLEETGFTITHVLPNDPGNNGAGNEQYVKFISKRSIQAESSFDNLERPLFDLRAYWNHLAL